jgi:hypothetical protein
MAWAGGHRVEGTQHARTRGVRREPDARQGGDSVALLVPALLIASNGTDSLVGSLTADWELFFTRHGTRDPSRRRFSEIEARIAIDGDFF